MHVSSHTRPVQKPVSHSTAHNKNAANDDVQSADSGISLVVALTRSPALPSMSDSAITYRHGKDGITVQALIEVREHGAVPPGTDERSFTTLLRSVSGAQSAI